MYHQTPVSVWVDGRYLGSADAQIRIRKVERLFAQEDEYRYISNKHMALVVASPLDLNETTAYSGEFL